MYPHFIVVGPQTVYEGGSNLGCTEHLLNVEWHQVNVSAASLEEVSAKSDSVTTMVLHANVLLRVCMFS